MALSAYAPTEGTGATDMGVRDTWVPFPDINDQDQLQRATTTKYNALKEPVKACDMRLHIYPGGPGFTLPGRQITLQSTDDEFIPDGDNDLRVVGLRISKSLDVTPEVQYA
jgi:hypothetical protein